jgi:hypothetical protein
VWTVVTMWKAAMWVAIALAYQLPTLYFVLAGIAIHQLKMQLHITYCVQEKRVLPTLMVAITADDKEIN